MYFENLSISCSVNIEEYKSIMAIITAVKEINQNPNLLPNFTLGYHIFNTCNDPIRTFGYSTRILSGEKDAPNYYCKRHGDVAGFIGDSDFHTNRAVPQLLNLYRYTQVGDYSYILCMYYGGWIY